MTSELTSKWITFNNSESNFTPSSLITSAIINQSSPNLHGSCHNTSRWCLQNYMENGWELTSELTSRWITFNNTQSNFTPISLITFAVINQTSPNLQGSCRNNSQCCLQNYMENGWELTSELTSKWITFNNSELNFTASSIITSAIINQTSPNLHGSCHNTSRWCLQHYMENGWELTSELASKWITFNNTQSNFKPISLITFAVINQTLPNLHGSCRNNSQCFLQNYVENGWELTSELTSKWITFYNSESNFTPSSLVTSAIINQSSPNLHGSCHNTSRWCLQNYMENGWELTSELTSRWITFNNTQSNFTPISLITFAVINQTSPNLQGSCRNNSQCCLQNYMENGWELTSELTSKWITFNNSELNFTASSIITSAIINQTSPNLHGSCHNTSRWCLQNYMENGWELTSELTSRCITFNNTQSNFTPISLITFAVINQTSPNLQGSCRNNSQCCLQNYMENGWELTSELTSKWITFNNSESIFTASSLITSAIINQTSPNSQGSCRNNNQCCLQDYMENGWELTSEWTSIWMTFNNSQSNFTPSSLITSAIINQTSPNLHGSCRSTSRWCLQNYMGNGWELTSELTSKWITFNNTQSNFKPISLITFAVINQTSPNLHGSCRNNSQCCLQNYMENGWELTSELTSIWMTFNNSQSNFTPSSLITSAIINQSSPNLHGSCRNTSRWCLQNYMGNGWELTSELTSKWITFNNTQSNFQPISLITFAVINQTSPNIHGSCHNTSRWCLQNYMENGWELTSELTSRWITFNNTQSNFTPISLITFAVINQTSPNLQGSCRNNSQCCLQNYMENGWELTSELTSKWITFNNSESIFTASSLITSAIINRTSPNSQGSCRNNNQCCLQNYMENGWELTSELTSIWMTFKNSQSNFTPSSLITSAIINQSSPNLQGSCRNTSRWCLQNYMENGWELTSELTSKWITFNNTQSNFKPISLITFAVINQTSQNLQGSCRNNIQCCLQNYMENGWELTSELTSKWITFNNSESIFTASSLITSAIINQTSPNSQGSYRNNNQCCLQDYMENGWELTSEWTSIWMTFNNSQSNFTPSSLITSAIINQTSPNLHGSCRSTSRWCLQNYMGNGWELTSELTSNWITFNNTQSNFKPISLITFAVINQISPNLHESCRNKKPMFPAKTTWKTVEN